MLSRQVIAEINKAINNNRNYLMLSNSAKFKKEILSILHTYGFIQGLEFRGAYTVVYLKQQYWKNWGIISKSIIKIAPLKLSKTGTVSLKKIKYINKLFGNAYCNIISTDKGITSSHDNNNSGGISLIKIL